MKFLTLFLGGFLLAGGAARGASYIVPPSGVAGSGTIDPTNQVLVNLIGTASANATNTFYTTNLSIGYNWATALSNAPSFTFIKLQAGTNSVTPQIVHQHGKGGINMIAKTNIVIEGYGVTLSGRAAIGEILYLSNCVNITIRGITFDGLVLTNTSTYTDPYSFGLVSLSGCDKITFEDCNVLNGHNFGIIDLAIQSGVQANTAVTTNATVRNCHFDNCGSHFVAPFPLPYDGAAIAFNGWLIEGNTIENCMGGIEPFEDTLSRPVANAIIRNNKLKNNIRSAIFVQGHTNSDALIIENNFILNELGYTRRGSNFLVDSSMIIIESGHRHRIRNNTIIGCGTNAYGIFLGGPTATRMDELVVSGNTISGVDSGLIVGAFDVSYSYGSQFLGNKVVAAITPYRIGGLFNGVVAGNQVQNVRLGVPGIRMYANANFRNTNVLVQGNLSADTFNTMTYGFSSDSGNVNIIFGDNQSIGHVTGVLNGTVVTRGFVGTAGLPEFNEGTSHPLALFPATNANVTLVRVANSNAFHSTNIVGIVEKASAAVVELNANDANQFNITNRVTAATTVVITNTASDQDINVTIVGEVAGGTSRVITLVPMLGHLVADLDTFGAALALTTSFTLTNGNAARVSWKINKLRGTNVVAKSVRQYAF